MGIQGISGSVQTTPRHFRKDLFDRALAAVPLHLSIRWVKLTPTAGATNMNRKPSAAQETMGDIAPKFAELTDKVLFGDIRWPGSA